MSDRSRGKPSDAFANLPSGSLVILRDYDHPSRRAWLDKEIRKARRAGHHPAIAWAKDRPHRAGRHIATHLPAFRHKNIPYLRRLTHGMITTSAHNLKELRQAQQQHPSAILLSTAYPTQSHPGRRPNNSANLRRAIHQSKTPIIALGGVRKAHFRQLRRRAYSGIAGIGLFHHA